jgi:DNA-binding GntR family transcriptional regulator
MEIQSVTETVSIQLRKEIITGKLTPGSKLNETKLSQKYGVSRPPLRESLRRLENEKLVVSVPRKGTFVASMSVQDCHQIYRARLMLEFAAIDILSEQDITQLPLVEKAHNSAKRIEPSSAVSIEEMLDKVDVMSEVHHKLVESCGNQWIIQYFNALAFSLARYQVLYINLTGSWKHSMEDHVRLIELVSDRKYEKAKELLKNHISNAHRLLIERMNDAPIKSQTVCDS